MRLHNKRERNAIKRLLCNYYFMPASEARQYIREAEAAETGILGSRLTASNFDQRWAEELIYDALQATNWRALPPAPQGDLDG